jgi:hypothetical protein
MSNYTNTTTSALTQQPLGSTCIDDTSRFVAIVGVFNLLVYVWFTLSRYSVVVKVQISLNCSFFVLALAASFAPSYVPSDPAVLVTMMLMLAVGVCALFYSITGTLVLIADMILLSTVLLIATVHVQNWFQEQLHVIISSFVVVIGIILCIVILMAAWLHITRIRLLTDFVNCSIAALLAAMSLKVVLQEWGPLHSVTICCGGDADCPMALSVEFVGGTSLALVTRLSLVTWARRKKVKPSKLKERRKRMLEDVPLLELDTPHPPLYHDLYPRNPPHTPPLSQPSSCQDPVLFAP